MAARLTDKQKKKIIADYAELGSYTAVAKKNGVSKPTVRRIVTGNAEVTIKVTQKKEENTLSMISFMETKKKAAQEIVDQYLKALADPEKLERASTRDVATALGIVVDKFTGNDASIERIAKGVIGRFLIPALCIGKSFVDLNRSICPNKDYIFEGGRGGMKSSYISLKIVELIKNNPIMHACVVRKVAGTLRDSVFAQIKWAIDILGLNNEFESKVSPMEIVYKPTGQKIYFRGCDDPIKLKSIKPPFGYIGILWVEERDQLSGPEEERNVKQSVLRGGAESYFFASYNPPKSKQSWVNREKLEQSENRIVHYSCYLDAPPEWLGTKFLEDAEHLKEVNPSAYEHEYMGVANGSGGNVFEYLELREITDDEIARMDRIYQGVDWGWYPDHYAFIRAYYDSAREKIYLIDENYVNKQANSQTGKWILDRKYNDYVITCDSAEPKSINDYKDMGLPARGAIKGPGSIEYGFKWLQCRTIVIDRRRTPNAYTEIINYEYERDKDGNVISGYPDANNHLIDAARYAFESLWTRRGNSA